MSLTIKSYHILYIVNEKICSLFSLTIILFKYFKLFQIRNYIINLELLLSTCISTDKLFVDDVNRYCYVNIHQNYPLTIFQKYEFPGIRVLNEFNF